MDRIVKVFCSGPEQASLARERKTLARYPGFLVIEAPKQALTALRRKYPVEDITHLYTIDTGERSSTHRVRGSMRKENATRILRTGM